MSAAGGRLNDNFHVLSRPDEGKFLSNVSATIKKSTGLSNREDSYAG